MDLQRIFELEQAPVRFQSHPAVQRDIVLTTAVVVDNDNLATELTEKKNSLAESINYRMLPLYIKTNLDITSKYAGLYPIIATEDEFKNGFDQYQWMYDFIQEHTEIEKVALVNNPDVLMMRNPFPEVDENKIYIADELKNLSKINYNRHSNTDIAEFMDSNANLQLLSDAVVVGTRTIILEFLGLWLSFKNDKHDNLEISDISLFNYLIYRYFTNRVIHGRKVSSIMGFRQIDTPAWFRCD